MGVETLLSYSKKSYWRPVTALFDLQASAAHVLPSRLAMPSRRIKAGAVLQHSIRGHKALGLLKFIVVCCLRTRLVDNRAVFPEHGQLSSARQCFLMGS